MTNGQSVHKNKGIAPKTPENDENDENGGCHARKDPVCQKPCFCNRDCRLFSDFLGASGLECPRRGTVKSAMQTMIRSFPNPFLPGCFLSLSNLAHLVAI